MRRTDAQSAAVPIKISYFNGRVVSNRSREAVPPRNALCARRRGEANGTGTRLRPAAGKNSGKRAQALFPVFRRQAEGIQVMVRCSAPQSGFPCRFAAIRLLYVANHTPQAASVDHGRHRRPWSMRSRPVRPFAETGFAGLRKGPLAQMFLGTFGRVLFSFPTSPAAPAADRQSAPGSCCPGPGSA